MQTQQSIFEKLHENEKLLYYLRIHPKWYKILYFTPERYGEFIKYAKNETNQTVYHKFESITDKISMINLFINTLVN